MSSTEKPSLEKHKLLLQTILDRLESPSEPTSLFIRILELGSQSYFVEADDLLDQCEHNTFTVVMGRVMLSIDRGDLRQALTLLERPLNDLSPLDSLLQRAYHLAVEMQLLLDERDARQALDDVANQLQRYIEQHPTLSDEQSILGSYTPLLIYHSLIGTRTQDMGSPGEDGWSRREVSTQLEKIGHAWLRLGLESLAFSAFKVDALLRENQISTLRKYATLANNRGRRNDALPLSLMALQLEDLEEKPKMREEDDLIRDLEAECKALSNTNGLILLAMRRDIAKYETGPFESIHEEYIYVDLMRQHQSSFRKLGGFTGEKKAIQQLLWRSVEFVDPSLVDACRESALELIDRWGDTITEVEFRLHFSSWFHAHGYGQTGFDHAKKAYDLARGRTLWQYETQAAMNLCHTAAVEQRMDWAQRAYTSCQRLDDNHPLRRQATTALASMSDSATAFELLQPYIETCLKGDPVTLLDAFNPLCELARCDEGEDDQLAIMIYLYTRAAADEAIDPRVRSVLSFVHYDMLAHHHFIHGDYTEAVDNAHLGLLAARTVPFPLISAYKSPTWTLDVVLFDSLIRALRFDEGLDVIKTCLEQAQNARDEVHLSYLYWYLTAAHGELALDLHDTIVKPDGTNVALTPQEISEAAAECLRYATKCEASLDKRRRDADSLPPSQALTTKSQLAPTTGKLYETILNVAEGRQHAVQIWCWIQASKSRSYLEVSALLKRHSSDLQLMDSTAALTLTASTKRYEDIMGRLPPGVVVAEWFVVAGDIHLMVCKPSEHPIIVNLDRKYSEAYLKIDELCKPSSWALQGQTLLDKFAYLVEPLLDHTLAGQHIILVPTLAMYRMPLHAIRINGQYLLQRNPISYTLSIMALASQRTRTDTLRTSESIIAFPKGQKFPLAPDVQASLEKRIENLSHECKDSSLVVGSDATTSTALDSMPETDLILLLSHAVPARDKIDPLSASFLMAGTDLLTARHVTELDLDARVTILAGCDSLHGRNAEHGDYLGFITSFLLAGSRTVLGTLYQVDLEDTVPIVTNLIRKIRACRNPGTEEKTMAQLVREVLLEHMQEKDGKGQVIGERSLRHWGAFSLYGDGSVSFS